MKNLEAVIQEFIRKKQPVEIVMPEWNIQIQENSGLNDLYILLIVKNDLRFQYKYHSVLDVSGSGIFYKDKNGSEDKVNFMLNVFVDLMNGGVTEFGLSSDMHDLVLLKEKKGQESNGIIQIFDQANEKCLFTKRLVSIARLA